MEVLTKKNLDILKRLKFLKTAFEKLRQIPKELIWYVLYGLFCLILFIYIRFPYGKLQEVVLAQLNNNLAVNISVKEKSFWFPLGFKWKNVKITKTSENSQVSSYNVEELKVGLNIIPFIILRKSYYIDVQAYGGEIAGNLFLRKNEYQIDEKTVKDLELNRIYTAKNEQGSKLSGKLNSSFNLSVPNEGILLATGQASVNLKDVKIENFWPLLPKVALSDLKTEIKFFKGRGTIKTLEAIGDDIKITGKGSFDLSNQFSESKLNINMQISTKGKSFLGKLILALRKGKRESFIPVSITGSLSKPLIRVAGIPLNQMTGTQEASANNENDEEL